MKLLFQLIKKELTHIFRDKLAVVMQIILPVIALSLTGQVVSTDLHYVNVAAVVPNQTEVSTSYLKPLLYNKLFRFKGIVTSIEDGMVLLKQGRVHALVVLSCDFDRRMTTGTKDGASSVQIITDNSNTLIGNTATYYITSALNQSSDDYVSVQAMYNPGLLSIYYYGISIYAYLLVLMVAHRAAVSMVGEKTRHSIDNVIMSSVSTKLLMLGKLITYLIFYCIIAAIGFFVIRFILNVPFNGSIWLFAAIMIILLLNTLFLGFFISLSSATESNASSTAIFAVSLFLLFFSGFLYPTDSMPDWAQIIGKLFYTKWYIDAAQKVFLQGVGINCIAKEILFMSVSMVTFVILCFYRLRKEKWLL